MSSKFSLVLIVCLTGLLMASIAGNRFLFSKAIEFYTREAAVRVTPINLSRYATANGELRRNQKSKPRIIIFGESRCAMWSTNVPQNWGDIQVVNRGIGGETTPQIKYRLEQDVIENEPDLVILQMGDNDIKTIAMLPHLTDTIVEQTYQNIVEIASRIAATDTPVILTTIFPPAPIEFLRKPLWSPEVVPQIDALNQRLLALEFPGVTVVDCDQILRHGDHIDPKFAIDTLHLNSAGYDALNQGLEPTVKRLLQP